MNIQLDKQALMPVRAHNTDAGLDLLSPVDTVVPAHGAGSGGKVGGHRTRNRRVRQHREVSRMCIAAQIILVAGAVIVAFFGVIGFGPNFNK